VQLICTCRVLIRRNGVARLSSIRILIADDFEDWRRQVHLLLQARPAWQIIAEVSDGSEAVQKAENLKPDLILLDIGLPNLTGIEAALRIRQLSPNSKIIFLSQNNDLDIVRAALGTGALGYVRKTDAGSELLPAVDAVLRGKQFVSSSLKGYELSDTSVAKAPHRHEVLFYPDDAVFLDTCTRFIAAALGAGDVVAIAATESHRDSLFQRLKAEGLDVDAEIERGRYISLDVAKTLSTFIVNDMPDWERFYEVVGGLVSRAAKAGKGEHSRVAMWGECGPLLWAEGKVHAAIRLEQLLNQLATIYEFDLLCAYALSSFHGEEDEHVFQSICAEHSAVCSQ
jgi:DNA-binding NarL/FixJ family response regulator